MPTLTRTAEKPQLVFGEILSFAYDTFCSNKVRFLLTSLGMTIGTASLILVVTIGLTGKEYVLNQIQAIGANEVFVEYEGGADRITATTPDPLTVSDLRAIREQVSGITNASPVVPLDDRVSVNGKERDVRLLGVFPEYRWVRNLVVVSGRFFDEQDSQARNKVGIITVKIADDLYGSPHAAIGQVLKFSGLPFTIIGTFKESVETFGQTEVQSNTMVIPYTVSRLFTNTPTVKLMYFSVADQSLVPSTTEHIKRVLESRHRPESVYSVQNLSQLLVVAERTANALTMVLLAVSLVVLLVSGIGIMNIMLATVTSRIREIGIRKAIGATNREIQFQFLSEAILISLFGGIAGIVIGLALPFSIRFVSDYRVPVSGWSAVVALIVSSAVGILFGTVPASRAAQLDPVESLRYE
ncbi:MAG: ABC transporter permease [Acidobacteria bacterium]|nr:ABC transporter permease [Acidobacteriota bacterium]MBV8892371.1 ABC transporter permease [Acidobacteriota bacterium]MBV9482257.1 ABC transporter permease [Acidobacteriota bacterium]